MYVILILKGYHEIIHGVDALAKKYKLRIHCCDMPKPRVFKTSGLRTKKSRVMSDFSLPTLLLSPLSVL